MKHCESLTFLFKRSTEPKVVFDLETGLLTRVDSKVFRVKLIAASMFKLLTSQWLLIYI